MTVCPRCDAHFDVVRPEPNPPEAIEAAARALADKLHWFDDDERARLAVAALTAAAAVSRPVPAPEPEDALEDALLLSFWECGHGTQPDSLDPDCPACAARARMIEATSPDPVVPVDDEPWCKGCGGSARCVCPPVDDEPRNPYADDTVCWCPDDWREPFDKARCPQHGGAEYESERARYWREGREAGRAAERAATDELREALREITHVRFRTPEDMQRFAADALARSVSSAPTEGDTDE